MVFLKGRFVASIPIPLQERRGKIDGDNLSTTLSLRVKPAATGSPEKTCRLHKRSGRLSSATVAAKFIGLPTVRRGPILRTFGSLPHEVLLRRCFRVEAHVKEAASYAILPPGLAAARKGECGHWKEATTLER